MAWNAALGIAIRAAIGDTTLKYPDATLAPVILTAAQGVLFNITPTQSYAIDVLAGTLTPDPTDPAINDTAFSYLVTLKSSAMLLRAEVRLYGKQAISIRDGTSAIDLKRDLRTLSELADKYDSDLKDAIAFFIRNNTLGIGMAVVSPYPNLLPRMGRYFCDTRSDRW